MLYLLKALDLCVVLCLYVWKYYYRCSGTTIPLMFPCSVLCFAWLRLCASGTFRALITSFTLLLMCRNKSLSCIACLITSNSISSNFRYVVFFLQTADNSSHAPEVLLRLLHKNLNNLFCKISQDLLSIWALSFTLCASIPRQEKLQ